jgi:ribonucleoside-diphosphate reductase alpha chain
VSFVPLELKEIHSSVGGAWVDGKYIPSLVALIGSVLERHFIKLGILPEQNGGKTVVQSKSGDKPSVGSLCPKCGAPALIHQEGCDLCLSCSYTTCG